LANLFEDEVWIKWFDQLSDEGYVVIDNFLSGNLFTSCKQFLIDKLSEDDFTKAGVGSRADHQIVSSVRGDFVYWLYKDRDTRLIPFFSLADELKDKLNRFCYLSLSGYEFHLAYYPEGTHYEKHLDQFRERNNRLISVVIYLNEGWAEGDGGELVIYKNSDEIKVQPLASRCVLFKSDQIEHEVLYTNKPRYSITGWLLYYPPGVGNIIG